VHGASEAAAARLDIVAGLGLLTICLLAASVDWARGACWQAYKLWENCLVINDPSIGARAFPLRSPGENPEGQVMEYRSTAVDTGTTLTSDLSPQVPTGS